MNAAETALLVTAVMTTGVAVTFTTVVSLRHNDAANRMWAAGFCIYALGMWAIAVEPASMRGGQHAIAAGASLLFPISLSWGAALLQQRRATLEVVALCLAVPVTVWVASTTPEGERWGSRAVLMCLVVLACFAGAYRFASGPPRHNVNARILTVVCSVAGVVMFGSACAPDGPHHQVAVHALGALLVIAAPCLTALRVEQSANWWATRDETTRRDLLGVLSRSAFHTDADDRIQRARRLNVATYLTLMRIDGLSEINTAFGRDAGDAALGFAARVVSQSAPPSALLGHLGAGVFAVLSTEDGALIESSIRTGLLRNELPTLLPTRFDVTTSVLTTRPGQDLAALLDDYEAMAAATPSTPSTRTTRASDEHAAATAPVTTDPRDGQP